MNISIKKINQCNTTPKANSQIDTLVYVFVSVKVSVFSGCY